MSKFTQALQAKQASLQPFEPAQQAHQAVAQIEPTPAKVVPRKPEKEPASNLTGKRSSSEYHQVNVYLKKETSNSAKIALLTNKDTRDFSELMEDLLSAWLAKQEV